MTYHPLKRIAQTIADKRDRFDYYPLAITDALFVDADPEYFQALKILFNHSVLRDQSGLLHGVRVIGDSIEDSIFQGFTLHAQNPKYKELEDYAIAEGIDLEKSDTALCLRKVGSLTVRADMLGKAASEEQRSASEALERIATIVSDETKTSLAEIKNQISQVFQNGFSVVGLPVKLQPYALQLTQLIGMIASNDDVQLAQVAFAIRDRAVYPSSEERILKNVWTEDLTRLLGKKFSKTVFSEYILNEQTGWEPVSDQGNSDSGKKISGKSQKALPETTAA